MTTEEQSLWSIVYTMELQQRRPMRPTMSEFESDDARRKAGAEADAAVAELRKRTVSRVE